MCIICSAVTVEGTYLASDFLSAYAQSRATMKAAAAALLVFANSLPKDKRSQYTAIHKQMVRQIRRWNRIEQEREK